ncbi:MAG TPA: hypothetical protein VIN58_04720 [Roseateles sp.]
MNSTTTIKKLPRSGWHLIRRAFLLLPLAVAACTGSKASAADERVEVITKAGGHHFSIPLGYIRNRSPGYVDQESWWLEALWPQMTPWRGGNSEDDVAFHAPGGGGIVSVMVHFTTALRVDFLERMAGLKPLGDLPESIDFPDAIKNRSKGPSIYGLEVYRIDFQRVRQFLGRNRASTPELDEFGRSRWDDLFMSRNEGVNTVITCTTDTVNDPPKIDRKKIVLVPQCRHIFVLKEFDASIELRYRRTFLSNWKDIENTTRSLIRSFQKENRTTESQ